MRRKPQESLVRSGNHHEPGTRMRLDALRSGSIPQGPSADGMSTSTAHEMEQSARKVLHVRRPHAAGRWLDRTPQTVAAG